MAPHFGPTRSLGVTSELEGLLKQLLAVTVKFSNDKLIKATGFLREALQLYKLGDRASQDEFTKIFGALEMLKVDRSCSPIIQHIEAVSAILPAFAIKILPSELPMREHFAFCKESSQYYLDRILKAAKESNDSNNVNWVNAITDLLFGLIKDATRNDDVGPKGTSTVEHGGKGTVEHEGGKNDFVIEEANVQVDQSKESSEEPVDISMEEDGEEATCCDNDTQIVDTNDNLVVRLEGNRWYIRKTINLPEPVIVSPEAFNQSLVIEDSKKLAVKVESKVNAVLVDKCDQLDFELTDVVSSVELLGCTRVRLFLNGEVHVVVLDGCESVQIYLSIGSRNVKIITSKCMEINVVSPAGLLNPSLSNEEAEEYLELSVPVQFLTRINSHGKLITEPHEHVGV